MKKFLLKILLMTLVPLVVFAAPDKTQERVDYEVFKAKTEANIEALKSIKSQDLENFKSEIEAQKQLIEQLNHQVDWLGHWITIGSTIVTGLLLLIGFFAYKNARSDAKETSQKEAKEWFEKNTAQLNQQIDSLKVKLKTIEADIEKHAASAHERVDSLVADIENRTITDTPITITKEETDALNTKVEELKSIAEAMYKYKEWNTKAYAAYHRGDYEEAAKFWGVAAESTDANDIEISRSLFNKGFTQGDKLNQPEAAIATYDSLIQKFGDSQHAEVQVQVARAYVNKGATQGDKLNQPDAEIATYDRLIEKFGDSQHAEVQVRVARAYVNIAITQAKKLDKREAAIATYDSLIQKFGDSQHAEVLVQVARAYNGLGFSNLIKAKQNWKTKAKRDVFLTKATECFNKAISKCNENNQAMILGNIVYTDWLLGNKTKAEQQLKEALKIGGEELYKGTIGDTEIHTVPPDKTFRVLLDKVWAEVNS